MHITEERRGDVVVLTLREAETGPPRDLLSQFRPSLDAGLRKLVVDALGMRRFPAPHMGQLVRCRRLLRHAGGSLVVERPPLETAEGNDWCTARLDAVFAQFESLGDALKFLAGPQTD